MLWFCVRVLHYREDMAFSKRGLCTRGPPLHRTQSSGEIRSPGLEPWFPPRSSVLPCGSQPRALPSLHTHHPHVLNTNKQPFPKLSPLPPAPLPPLYSSLRNLPGKKNFIEVQLPHFLPLSLRNINPTQMSFYQPELLLFIQWDLASSSSPPPTHILSLPPSCPSISLPGRVFCSKLGFIQY